MYSQLAPARMGHAPAWRAAFWALLALLAGMILAGAAHAAAREIPGVAETTSKFPEGAAVYQAHCAACHETGAGRAPARIIIANMSAKAVLAALTQGAMQAQGSALSQDQKVAVVRHLTGKDPLAASTAAQAPRMCPPARAAFDRQQVPAYPGAGLDHAATHSIPTEKAGITKADLSRLKLKWAFAFPDANRARSQPALGGGAVFVGSQNGTVYALDRETGCVRWTFDAGSEVRTGIVLSPWQAGDEDAVPLAFFGDLTGHVYAVEAFSGKLAWKVEADDHPAAVITASPAFYGDILYVSVSSLEEAAAAAPGYPCCTFRGSVLALQARTGKEVWRTWLADEARPQEGTAQLGPAGAAAWAGIAIDEKHGNLILATGESYSHPVAPMSDSIIALDLGSGAVKWHFQTRQGDAWNVSCMLENPVNCPANAGPDFGFGAIPVLARGKDGKDYVLGGEKSGMIWAVDPASGALVWKRQVGRGGFAGGLHFGLAAIDGMAFAPVSDMGPPSQPTDVPASPGLYALDVATGNPVWSAPARPDVCTGRPLCVPGNSGAITVTPQLVFAGGDDGFMRIYDALNGAVLWQFDTLQDVATTDGGTAHGGAISGGAAPIVDGGQMFVSSGYGFVTKMPGNVLLVFEAR